MKKIHEKLLGFFESKILLGILYGIGIILILVLVFSAGMAVGVKKRNFGRAWGENYEKNFGMMPGPKMMKGLGPKDPMGDFPNAHGAVGKIVKIELPNIIVIDKDNTEKVIVVNEKTQIQEKREEIKINTLKIDDFVVIIGSPNEQGQIEAKFIRLMPVGMPEFFPPIPAPIN